MVYVRIDRRDFSQYEAPIEWNLYMNLIRRGVRSVVEVQGTRYPGYTECSKKSIVEGDKQAKCARDAACLHLPL